MAYANDCKEILDLFTATGKELPTEDSNMGRAVQILQTICDSQSHTVPEIETVEGWNGEAHPEDIQNENISNFSEIFEALEEIETNIGKDDFNLEFDGNEYRLINDSDIWQIYSDEIKSTVEECYSDVLKLDKIPSFISVSVDWDQTAKNAYVDGYGHTFSSYDGSEEESAGYYIFRTS
jgi:hypothetical protein